MKYRVQYSPEAREDARAIQRYLSQFSDKAPRRFRDTLKRRLGQVKDNPLMHEKYRYNPRFRAVVIEKYLLFYAVDEAEKTIYVYRLLHGAQDIPHLL